ncbi:MAG: hypothetical protein WCO63_10955 [Bacteroidota bacterium]
MTRKILFADLYAADGHLNEEGQALFVDALQLGKTACLPEDVKNHMSLCEDCRAEVALLYDMIAENKPLQPQIAHPVLDAKKSKRTKKGSGIDKDKDFVRRLFSPWALAASLLILFGIGSAIYFFQSEIGGGDQSRNDVAENSAKGIKNFTQTKETGRNIQYAENKLDQTITDNFGNARLEALYKLQLRGIGFKIKSPAKNSRIKSSEEISFEWESPLSIKKLMMVFIDKSGENKRQLLIDSRQKGIKIKLPPGYYYWIFIGDNEVISVGKIRVIAD